MDMDEAKAIGWAILIFVAVAMLELLRFVLFSAMLILGRVVEPVLSLLAGAGLFVFLTGWIFGPGRREPVIGGAVLAVGSMALLVLWNTVLQWVAPDDTIIISRY